MDVALKILVSLLLVYGYLLVAWTGWKAVQAVDDSLHADGRTVLAAIIEIMRCAVTFQTKPDFTIKSGIYFIAPYLSASAASLMIVIQMMKLFSGEWLYSAAFYWTALVHALFIIGVTTYHFTTILMTPIMRQKHDPI